MSYAKTVAGHKYDFRDIKDVLARANEEKSGDALAGISAMSERERVAAKEVLAEITMEALRREPVVPHDEDEVTKFIDDNLDEVQFQKIRNWSVAELRDFILADLPDGAGVAGIRLGRARCPL